MAKKKMSAAKMKAKANVKALGGKAFEAEFFEIRNEIDKVVATIQAGKKFGGTRKENAAERKHADQMIAALTKARKYALQFCCQNDQGCTLFMLKPPSR